MSYRTPKVETIIREDHQIEAYAILELFCELILARLDMLKMSKGPCPPDLQESVTTLIYAAPRCVTPRPTPTTRRKRPPAPLR